MLLCFRDITTCTPTMYVIACDLGKNFVFDKSCAICGSCVVNMHIIIIVVNYFIVRRLQ